MRKQPQALVLATLMLAGGATLSAQERNSDRDQNREPRRRTVWVSRDDDRPRLGVSTSSGSRRDTLGLLVTDVAEGGAAQKAGIEEGDRIASINGVNLRLSPEDAGDDEMSSVAQRRLIRELEKHKAGDEVELRVWSNGQWKTVKAKLTEPEDVLFGGTSMRARREEMENRAVLGIGLGSNGSRRDTLGLLVTSVSDEGPAEKGGVEEGDRIVSINGVDLRVAKEDAGDWSSSSARIRRLNREMEKVKPGDAVELKVYRDGQQRTLRVTAGKASELKDRGGFFFGDGMGFTLPRMPRAPEAPMPPMTPRFRWNDDGEMRFRVSPRLRADVEDGMRGLEQGLIELRRAIPRVRVQVEDDDGEGWSSSSGTAARAAPKAATGIAMASPAIRAVGGLHAMEPVPAVLAGGSNDEGAIYVQGLKLATVEGDLADYFGRGSDRGLLVLKTADGWEGLREGDVVLRIDGRAVRPEPDRVSIQLQRGSEHDVDFLRGGRMMNIRVPAGRD